MKEINISFKELVDYIRDKDFEINRLRSNIVEKNKRIDKLESNINKCIEFVENDYVYQSETIKEILTR